MVKEGAVRSASIAKVGIYLSIFISYLAPEQILFYDLSRPYQ